MTDQTVIIDTSPEAASIKTVTGWVSRTGQFWGDDERMARYCGSTHYVCTKNAEHGLVEQRSYCKKCHAEKVEQRWKDMEKVPFSVDAFPLCIYDSDLYFFDSEDLAYWLKKNELRPEQVSLVKCTPRYPAPIDPNEHFIDDLPEDGEISAELAAAFDALNAVIAKSEPLCWYPSNIGVLLPVDFLEAT